MKRRDELTPSLFDVADELEAQAVTEDIGNTDDELDDEQDDWQEVSQSVYLSWSPAMRLQYCWKRDLDAALRADHDDDAKFFLDRAALYKADLDDEKQA